MHTHKAIMEYLSSYSSTLLLAFILSSNIFMISLSQLLLTYHVNEPKFLSLQLSLTFILLNKMDVKLLLVEITSTLFSCTGTFFSFSFDYSGLYVDMHVCTCVYVCTYVFRNCPFISQPYKQERLAHRCYSMNVH